VFAVSATIFEGDCLLKNKTFIALEHENCMIMSSVYADGTPFSRAFVMPHLHQPLRMMEGLLFREMMKSSSHSKVFSCIKGIPMSTVMSLVRQPAANFFFTSAAYHPLNSSRIKCLQGRLMETSIGWLNDDCSSAKCEILGRNLPKIRGNLFPTVKSKIQISCEMHKITNLRN